ncbi:hypothetical protein D6825_00020 [Candidatus Woesearchaeota archaeon]|nr:MAG: hypothetical protein D6825_00020 [Candidatus Woesearchaeota archaeon]
MSVYAAITTSDLSQQILAREGDDILTVYEPDVSIEEIVLNELKSRSDVDPLLVGYHHTMVFASKTLRLVNIGTYLIAKQLMSLDAQVEEFVDLFCGAGFLGNFASVENICSDILMYDRSAFSIESAARSYGWNFSFSVRDRGKTSDYGLSVEHDNRRACFLCGPITLLGRRAARGVVAASVPLFIPQVTPGPDTYEMVMNLSYAARPNSDLLISHSSLATDHIKELAKRAEATHYLVSKKETQLAYDTIEGPEFLKLSSEQARYLERKGLIDYGKNAQVRWGHEWCVSRLEW